MTLEQLRRYISSLRQLDDKTPVLVYPDHLADMLEQALSAPVEAGQLELPVPGD